MTGEFKVSIITPVYNAEKYIVRTMDSVRAQTYENWEMLLTADCCTDNTVEIIEQYLAEKQDARIRLIMLEKNQGAAAARNRGLRESKGRFVAYLDADDVWVPEKLERTVQFLQEKDAAFVFTGYEFADNQAKGTGIVVHAPATLSYRQALGNTTIFTSTVMFDTEKIKKEELDMPLIESEDTALWWKVLRKGYLAYGLDENLVLYRRPDGGSLSSNKLKAIRRIWNLYRKNEGFGVIKSSYYFCLWALRAVERRL